MKRKVKNTGLDKILESNPLKAIPVIRPKDLVKYVRSKGLYDGLGKVQNAIIVYTSEWKPLFLKEYGFPQKNFFEFDVYQNGKKNILIMNVTTGGHNACHHLEKLHALGIRKVIALGHCGALYSQAKIGDLVLPSRAICGETASKLYLARRKFVEPDATLLRKLERICRKKVETLQVGDTLTSESMFHTPRKLIDICRNQGVLSLEAEAASIFALGETQKMQVATLLVVSNLITDRGWIPDFFAQEVWDAKVAMAETALEVLS